MHDRHEEYAEAAGDGPSTPDGTWRFHDAFRDFSLYYHSSRICGWDPSAAAAAAGCVDHGSEPGLGLAPEYSQWLIWRFGDSYGRNGKAALLDSIHRSVVTACLHSGMTQAYDALGSDMPSSVPDNLLAETWIELCGTGQREFEHYGTWSASASASSTDPGILFGLISDGHSWADAVGALADGYTAHGVACPTQPGTHEDGAPG